MRRTFVVLGLASAGALAAACPPPTPAWHAQVLERINALRASGAACAPDFPARPAPPLLWNALLAEMAGGQALWIAQAGRLDHADRGGVPLAERAAQRGYRYALIAENLAYGYPTDTEALAAWRTSAGHCRQLLDPLLTEAAVACHAGPGGPWWVMMLGTPQEWVSHLR